MRSPPAHGQSVSFSLNGPANDLNIEIEFTDHRFDDLILLIVFHAKDSDVWLHNVKQLRHDLVSQCTSRLSQ